MIPILYEKDEMSFTSSGLGRLRDCISCTVTEERNGIYECDFEYPVNGLHYDLIQCGRIIAVTHDDTNDVQPFDIVSYTKPLNGVVSFHAVHISYRQSFMTVKTNKGVNSLADAFTMLENSTPYNQFTYKTNKTSSGYLGASDGTPRTVKELLGGVEGSILDTYGGEYEFDKFLVTLHNSRGIARDFTIRYGVNMTDYNDETDISETYNSVIPYWTDNEKFVVGDMVSDGQTATGRGECIPLDVSDKFEKKPSKAQVESMASSIIQTNHPYLPVQTITVAFSRLQDVGYEWLKDLYKCYLCDSIGVEFPAYGMTGKYKIVKTEWDVLDNKYESMELGALSTSLSEAMGVSSGTAVSNSTIDDHVTAQGTTSSWYWRKWDNGMIEAWRTASVTCSSTSSQNNLYKSTWTQSIGSGIFSSTPNVIMTIMQNPNTVISANCTASSTTSISGSTWRSNSSSSTYSLTVAFYCWTE